MQSYATGNAAGAGRRANANSVRPILTKEFSYTGLGTGTTRTSGDYSYLRRITRTESSGLRGIFNGEVNVLLRMTGAS